MCASEHTSLGTRSNSLVALVSQRDTSDVSARTTVTEEVLVRTESATVRFATRCLGAALLGLLALAAVAHARSIDVPLAMRATLAAVRDDTPLAILLPSELDFGYDKRVFATGAGDQRSYLLTLTTRLPCGANSCYLASFEAKRALKSASWRGNVRLRGGRMGLFDARSCGGSCAPTTIEWYSRGNRYEIAAVLADRSDAAQRRRLVVAANSAIGAGPR